MQHPPSRNQPNPQQSPFQQPRQGYPPPGYQSAPNAQQTSTPPWSGAYGQPPSEPPKKKRGKLPLIIGGVVVCALLVCVISSIATSHGAASSTPQGSQDSQTTQSTDTPVPTDTPTPQPTLAMQLATSDAGGDTPDAGTVAQYQTLLDSLHRKTGDSEQVISNETIAGQKLVRDNYSKDVSLLELLQRADESDPGGTAKIHYNEVLAAYILLAYEQQH